MLNLFVLDDLNVIADLIEENETEYICTTGMGFKLINGKIKTIEYPLGIAKNSSMFILKKSRVEAVTSNMSNEILEIYQEFLENHKILLQEGD